MSDIKLQVENAAAVAKSEVVDAAGKALDAAKVVEVKGDAFADDLLAKAASNKHTGLILLGVAVAIVVVILVAVFK